MWPPLKYILIGIAILIAIFALGVGYIFYRSMAAAHANAEIIEEICRIPVGTPVEDVLPLARRLGIREEGDLSALGQAILIEPAADASDDRLPGLTRGRITLGKTVLPPFERHYCEITIENRKVISSRIKILD